MVWTNFLFRLVASTRPLSNDVFFSLCVGRKRKCNTRECSTLPVSAKVFAGDLDDVSYKIDAHDELRFTPTSTFNFDSLPSAAVLA